MKHEIVDKPIDFQQPVKYEIVDKPINYGDFQQPMRREIIKPSKLYNLAGTWEIQIYKSDLYNKKIILLSDAHKKQISCPNSKTLITAIGDSLTQPSKPFIDIYMEIPVKRRVDDKQRKLSSYMSEIESKFKGCFSYLKKCDHKNLRTHYVDNRILLPILRTISQLFMSAYESNNNNNEIESYLNSYDNNREKIREIFTNEKSITEYISTAETKSKISKQF